MGNYEVDFSASRPIEHARAYERYKSLFEPVYRRILADPAVVAEMARQKLIRSEALKRAIYFRLVTQDAGEYHASLARASSYDFAALSKQVVDMMRSCSACSNTNCTKLAKSVCKGCASARYCSGECQKEHWVSSHRSQCRARK